jgi:glycosyltransferase involved in cell wall biosynthesis
MKADFLAIGIPNQTWNKSDFHFIPPSRPLRLAIQEFVLFWKVVAKYEIIHSHNMVFLTESGWEDKWLKKMGRKIVVNYRGCDIRDRRINMQIQQKYDICEDCDYDVICEKDYLRTKRLRAAKIGNAFLVTTPDLLDFAPQAVHLPFFVPENHTRISNKKQNLGEEIKIFHATNHPGIEGTKEIERVIERLKEIGYRVNLLVLKGVSHERVLRELSTADLSIGKMKMGYYANFQIESMLMGVPAITYVRPEYVGDDLRKSGFIFTDLKNLEKTLKHYLDNPKKLEQKRKIARDSILKLHDNGKIAKQLISIYQEVKSERHL